MKRKRNHSKKDKESNPKPRKRRKTIKKIEATRESVHAQLLKTIHRNLNDHKIEIFECKAKQEPTTNKEWYDFYVSPNPCKDCAEKWKEYKENKRTIKDKWNDTEEGWKNFKLIQKNLKSRLRRLEGMEVQLKWLKAELENPILINETDSMDCDEKNEVINIDQLENDVIEIDDDDNDDEIILIKNNNNKKDSKKTILKKRAELITTIRNSLSHLTNVFLKTIIMHFKLTKKWKQKLKNKDDYINWIIQQISGYKVYGKREELIQLTHEKNRIYGFYPPSQGDFPQEIMQLIFEFLLPIKFNRKTLNGIGLLNNHWHTWILYSWKTLIVTEKNYKRIPELAWLYAETVMLKDWNEQIKKTIQKTKQNYIFKRLRNGKKVKKLYLNQTHFSCLNKIFFPNIEHLVIKTCSYLPGWFENQIQEKLYELSSSFPNLKTVYMTNYSDVNIRKIGHNMKNLKCISILKRTGAWDCEILKEMSLKNNIQIRLRGLVIDYTLPKEEIKEIFEKLIREERFPTRDQITQFINETENYEKFTEENCVTKILKKLERKRQKKIEEEKFMSQQLIDTELQSRNSPFNSIIEIE